MNILLCSDTFPPKMGGTENVVLTLAKTYTELGHNVMVVCGDCGELKEVLPFKLVKVPTLYMKHIDEYYSFPRLKKGLKKIIADFKPDVIHVHTIFVLANYMLDYAKKHNIRSVVTIHTKFNYSYNLHVPLKNTNPIHKAIVALLTRNPKKACEKADVITTVSESSKKSEIEDAYGVTDKAIKVIYNGYDYDANRMFDIGEYLALNDKNKLILCFAGRIDETKNIKFSMQLCKELSAKGVPFEFQLAGIGNQYNKWMKFIKKAHLENNVFLLGRKSVKELMKIYNQSDYMLFPSIFDNDSIATIEARSCGCPTIAIKNTGTSERIIDGQNGYICDNNIDSFALLLSKLFEKKQKYYDSVLCMREMTYKIQPKTWAEIANEYIEVYKTVVK